MGAVSSEAIISALETIRARLSEVEREFDTLTNERDALRGAEQSLLAIIGGELATGPSESGPPEQLARVLRESSFRAQLYADLQKAGRDGRTLEQRESGSHRPRTRRLQQR